MADRKEGEPDLEPVPAVVLRADEPVPARLVGNDRDTPMRRLAIASVAVIVVGFLVLFGRESYRNGDDLNLVLHNQAVGLAERRSLAEAQADTLKTVRRDERFILFVSAQNQQLRRALVRQNKLLAGMGISTVILPPRIKPPKALKTQPAPASSSSPRPAKSQSPDQPKPTPKPSKSKKPPPKPKPTPKPCGPLNRLLGKCTGGK